MLTGAGLIAGVGIAFLSSRWLTSLLFEVTPTDPVTLAAVVTVIIMVAAAARWSRRAGRSESTRWWRSSSRNPATRRSAAPALPLT